MEYDMGVISIIIVMKQFHQTYPFAETVFGSEFMTAVFLLGAFVGCPFVSSMADRYSRKWAFAVVFIVFDWSHSPGRGPKLCLSHGLTLRRRNWH